MAQDVDVTPVPERMIQGEEELAFTGISHPDFEGQGEVETPSEPVAEETTPAEEPVVEPQEDTPDWAAEKEGILGDLKSERQQRQELQKRIADIEARTAPQPAEEPKITDAVLAEALTHEDPQMREAAIKMMKQQAIEEMKAEQQVNFKQQQKFQNEVRNKTQEAMTTYGVKQGDKTWQLADELLRTDPEIQAYNGNPSLYAAAIGKAAFMRLKDSSSKVTEDVKHTTRMKEANHVERGSRPAAKGRGESDLSRATAKAFKHGDWHDLFKESGAFKHPDAED